MRAIVKRDKFITATMIPLDRNPAVIYLAKLTSINSRNSMHWCLNLAAEVLSTGRFDGITLNWPAMRYQHFAVLRARLQQENPRPIRKEPYSVSTINMTLTAVKGTICEAWKLELVSDADYLRFIDERGVRGEAPPIGRAMSEDEKRALFEVCREGPTICGIRDAAILASMLGVGLRRSEVVDLDYGDWNANECMVIVRKGKGRRYLEVPVGEDTKNALEDWVSIPGDDPGPFFYPLKWRDKLKRRRMSSDSVWSIVAKLYLKAGIEKVSPHDFRRTYITDLLLNGNDLAITAKLAGHRSVQTTRKYDRRGMEAMREAAIAVSVQRWSGKTGHCHK